MAKLPTFSSRNFQWTGDRGTSWCSDLGIETFPRGGFYIKSERTGQTRLFLPDAATNEAHEFFDGERSAYFVPGGNLKVQIGH
jgi:hypothetical protein